MLQPQPSGMRFHHSSAHHGLVVDSLELSWKWNPSLHIGLRALLRTFDVECIVLNLHLHLHSFRLAKPGCGWPSCIIIFQTWQDRRGLVNQPYTLVETEKRDSYLNRLILTKNRHSLIDASLVLVFNCNKYLIQINIAWLIDYRNFSMTVRELIH